MCQWYRLGGHRTSPVHARPSSPSEGLPGEGAAAHPDAERLAAAGITKGCNPAEGNTRFCGDRAITRSEIAAFLVRAYGYTDRDVDPFTDDDESIFEGNIDRLKVAGITKGCNPPGNFLYCPQRSITRAEVVNLPGTRGKACPSCGQYDMQMIEGCMTCPSCGHSKCG